MYDLGDIIGHENIKEYVHNVVRTNKVPHAFIFVGDKGCGKMTMAKVFSKILQCTGEEYCACGKCRSCLQMDSENQPDVIVVKKTKQNISIDDIRNQLTSDVSVKPYAGPYKIYIVPEAHKLREDAQNAILKTIEEPPQYAIIILLAENINSLLATIQSRCVSLQFKMVDTVDIKKMLMADYMIPDYAAHASAVFAEGNVGRAIMYARNEEFIEIRQAVIRLMSHINELDDYNIIIRAKEIAEHKDTLNEYLDLIKLWLRDVLIYKSTKDESKILYNNERDEIRRIATQVSYAYIENAMQAIDVVKQNLKLNVNAQLSVEMMLMKLKERRM